MINKIGVDRTPGSSADQIRGSGTPGNPRGWHEEAYQTSPHCDPGEGPSVVQINPSRLCHLISGLSGIEMITFSSVNVISLTFGVPPSCTSICNAQLSTSVCRPTSTRSFEQITVPV